MFSALRPVSSIAAALAGVLIASWLERESSSDEPEVFGGCPEAPPCPPCLEAGLTGLRSQVLSLLLRSDNSLEVIVGIGAACAIFVAGRALSHAASYCSRCCCETTSTRCARRVAGRAAIPGGHEASGDFHGGSGLLARKAYPVPGNLAQLRDYDGRW